MLMLAAMPMIAQSGGTKSGGTKSGPSPDATAKKMMQAIRQGISAARIKQTDEKLISFGNRSTLGSMDKALYKQGKGVKAAREWIKQEFERYSAACGNCMKVDFAGYTQQPGPRVAQPTEISDVYAVLEGTDPVEAKHIYLVTGHYDSRNSSNENITDPAPGANDDASGTSVSIECARVLSQHKFPATIIFLTVAGEEQGLYGSDYFAKWAKQQGWQIEGVLNNDIVGGNTTPGDTLQRKDVVRVFSEGIPITAVNDPKQVGLIRAIGAESDSPSRELAREMMEVGRTWMPGEFHPVMVFRQDRYLRGGDHTSFNKQGFAAVRITEWREDFNHQHQNVRTENGVQFGDLEKYVDFDYVANVARINALTLATMAQAPAPPKDVRMVTRHLQNDSTLEWAASDDANASFELVWRETTAPDWEHAKYLGKVTTVTVPESKDNVIFGVRAVSANGFKSYASTPVPER
ncbi:MAG: M28 family peptidase [Acidobacteriaceae bacterium]